MRAVVDVPLSVDTQKADVAEAALCAGAVMVNDVSGFSDPDMGAVVAKHGAAWVLMHMPHATGDMGWSARSQSMAQDLSEGCQQVVDELSRIVKRAEAAGDDASEEEEAPASAGGAAADDASDDE